MGTKERIAGFASTINSTFKTNIAFSGRGAQQLNSPRFSSGILSVDLAIGGGWPFNKVVLVNGYESTGKSLISLKATKSITDYDHVTKLHRDFVNPDQFEPGSALIVDVEGSFDSDWADAVADFSNYDHVVVRPETSEQAVDIITSALDENCFDLIILDSLAAMSPQKTLEESIEKQNIGLGARLNNEALRRWGAKFNATSHATHGATLMIINQIRDNIGAMFGPSETLPGGKGQKFFSSITVRMGMAKIENGENVENAFGNYKGVIQKNKTFTAKQNFEFNMCVVKGESVPQGTINNSEIARKSAARLGLITGSTGEYVFGELKAKTLKEMTKLIEADERQFRRLWRNVVEQETGYIDGKVSALRT